MIEHTFVEKCCESHFRAFAGQICKDARIRGWAEGRGGWWVKPILAMPAFWEHLALAAKHHSRQKLSSDYIYVGLI